MMARAVDKILMPGLRKSGRSPQASMKLCIESRSGPTMVRRGGDTSRRLSAHGQLVSFTGVSGYVMVYFLASGCRIVFIARRQTGF